VRTVLVLALVLPTLARADSISYSTLSLPSGSSDYLNIDASGRLSRSVGEKCFVKLSQQQLQQLWREVDAADFFALKAEYYVPNLDGDNVGNLEISRGGRKHKVTLINTNVAAFDRIVRVVEAVARETFSEADVPFRGPFVRYSRVATDGSSANLQLSADGQLTITLKSSDLPVRVQSKTVDRIDVINLARRLRALGFYELGDEYSDHSHGGWIRTFTVEGHKTVRARNRLPPALQQLEAELWRLAGPT
jgi:hypothetical protein